MDFFTSTGASATASLGLLIVLFSYLIFNWSWSRKLVWFSTPVQMLTILVSGNRLSLALTSLIAFLALVLLCRRDRIAALAMSFGIVGTLYLLVDPQADLLDRGLSKAGISPVRDKKHQN